MDAGSGDWDEDMEQLLQDLIQKEEDQLLMDGEQEEGVVEQPTPDAKYAQDVLSRKAASYDQKEAEKDGGAEEAEKPAGDKPKEEGEEETPYVRPESFKGIHEELSWVISVHPEERDVPYEPNEEEMPYLLDEELFYDYVLP